MHTGLLVNIVTQQVYATILPSYNCLRRILHWLGIGRKIGGVVSFSFPFREREQSHRPLGHISCQRYTKQTLQRGLSVGSVSLPQTGDFFCPGGLTHALLQDGRTSLQPELWIKNNISPREVIRSCQDSGRGDSPTRQPLKSKPLHRRSCSTRGIRC